MHDEEPVPPAATNAFDAMSATPPVAWARFVCVRHGTEAGVVRLHGSLSSGWMMVLESTLGGRQTRIDDPAANALRDALARADVHAIHQLNEEWAPFFCPVCDRVYCGECWRTLLVFDPDDPGWLDEVRGTCPEGHERMLSD